MTNNPTTAARSYIEEANAKINAYIKAGQFEKAGEYFAEDLIQLVAGQPPIHGRQAWVDAQRQNARIGAWDLELQVLELEVRDDIAVERGRGVQTFTANESSPMPSFSMVGNYMVLWKKVGDDWQITWDYVVPSPPPEE